MRTPLSVLSIALLASTSLTPVLAADALKEPVQELTPEQLQEQQWETECRATMHSGQGDLQAALLRLLLSCVNSKRTAAQIQANRQQELKRLADRGEREAARRDAVLARIKRGFQNRLKQAQTRLTEQGDKGQRTRQSYSSVHGRLRTPGLEQWSTEP